MMKKGSSSAAQHPTTDNIVFLDQVAEGCQDSIMVMICRKWDVISMNGQYISTDYIISDKKGNIMHCVAKNQIAHRFVDKFEEGGLYVLRDFIVAPNTKNFRVMKDASHIIHLQWSTSVRKVTDDASMFKRYPFQLVKFEDLEPTDNMYFVDVIGYVTIVGNPTQKSNGSQTVEFNLTNESGEQVRVTLWGELGNEMIARKKSHPGPYTILFACMSVKPYIGNVCLSSTSSTMLIDDENIPDIQAFKAAVSGSEIIETDVPSLQLRPNIETLEELLHWSCTKGKKEVGAFRNLVEITDVRTRVGWFNFSCTKGSCRKGVSRTHKRVFWCDSCETTIMYPRARFRVELEISDGTGSVVAVLFDEPAEKLLGRTAQQLIAECDEDESGESVVLPPALRNLVGSKHIFEIKSSTYYHVGEYQSFNCSDVVLSEEAPVTTSKNVNDAIENKALLNEAPKKVEHAASQVTSSSEQPLIVPTPKKKNEGGKRNRSNVAYEAGKLAPDRAKKKASAFVTRSPNRRRVISDSENEANEDGGTA